MNTRLCALAGAGASARSTSIAPARHQSPRSLRRLFMVYPRNTAGGPGLRPRGRPADERHAIAVVLPPRPRDPDHPAFTRTAGRLSLDRNAEVDERRAAVGQRWRAERLDRGEEHPAVLEVRAAGRHVVVGFEELEGGDPRRFARAEPSVAFAEAQGYAERALVGGRARVAHGVAVGAGHPILRPLPRPGRRQRPFGEAVACRRPAATGATLA